MAESQAVFIVLANFLAFVIIAIVIVHDVRSGQVGKRSRRTAQTPAHASTLPKRSRRAARRSENSPARAAFKMDSATKPGQGEVRLPEYLEQVSNERLAEQQAGRDKGLSDTQLAVIIAEATRTR
ncbi:hypothetical protein BH20ACT11_BH20ACT11_05420 [soil metagenome]